MEHNFTKTLTDKIIVRDFVVMMMIGIYDHEYLKPQRVRFNIDVDISKVSFVKRF